MRYYKHQVIIIMWLLCDLHGSYVVYVGVTVSMCLLRGIHGCYGVDGSSASVPLVCLFVLPPPKKKKKKKKKRLLQTVFNT